MKINLRNIPKVSQHPLTILAAVVAGVALGKGLPEWVPVVSGIGDLYLKLLEMCILPLMMAAIVSSVGSMFMSNVGERFIARTALVFILGLFAVALLSIVMGVIFSPGASLNHDSIATMGKEIIRVENHGDWAGDASRSPITDFLREVIPSNVFDAATKGKNLSLLFFSILLGAALGLCKDKGGDTALRSAGGAYEAILKMIGWVMFLLPVGLIFIVAGQVQRFGADLVSSMARLVAVIILTSLLLSIIYTWIIHRATGSGPIKALTQLRSPLMIALVTANSYASIPSALEKLKHSFHLDRQKTDLVLPMGISLNPQGNVIHFVIATLFVAQIYGAQLSFSDYLIVAVAGTFAAIAAAGAPGIAALSMLVIVFEPLQLPTTVGIILLAAIDPIIDPILTAANLHCNCATSAILASDGQPQPHSDSSSATPCTEQTAA